MKIELTAEQLATIDEALQQLPYNIAAPLIDQINLQKKNGNVSLPVFKVESDPRLMTPTENAPLVITGGYSFNDNGRFIRNHEGMIIGQIKDSTTMLC